MRVQKSLTLVAWAAVAWQPTALAGETHEWPDIFPTPAEVLGSSSSLVDIGGSVKLNVVDRPGWNPNLAPILFVHGWPDSWRSFQRVLPLLGSERRLIAFDQRGYGLSSKPLNASYDMPMFASDIAALLDALSIPRLHCLVGHSMGSIISWHFAGRYPARLESLVLIGTTPLALSRPTPVFSALSAVVLPLDQVTYAFAKEFQYSTFVNLSTAGEWFTQTTVHESVLVPLHVFKASFAGMLAVTRSSARSLLSRVTARVVLVRGAADELFDERNAQDLLRALPPSIAISYVEVAEAGHSVQWEEPGARAVAKMIQQDVAALSQEAREQSEGGIQLGVRSYLLLVGAATVPGLVVASVLSWRSRRHAPAGFGASLLG